MYNRIILIGCVVVQPEMRYTQKGSAVARFTLAVDRPKNKTAEESKEQSVDFISVIAWMGLAEICGKYLNKGKLVCIEGRLQIRSYTDRDGNKRKAAEVIANDMRMLGASGQLSGNSEQLDEDDLPS